jgi:Family of unknown function (DUF6533)
VGIDYDPNVPTVRKLTMSVASIMLLFYDYVLTLGEEVRLPGPIRFVSNRLMFRIGGICLETEYECSKLHSNLIC